VTDDEFGNGRLLFRDRFIEALVVDPCTDLVPGLTPHLALANPGAKTLHHEFSHSVASACVNRAHVNPQSVCARDPHRVVTAALRIQSSRRGAEVPAVT
jgi:hypothetical protein